MTALITSGIIVLACPTAKAEQTKTKYNPYTTKLDYITALSTNSIKAGTNVTVSTNANGVTVSATSAGDGGIISPGTFTWVNTSFGLRVSTFSTTSSSTVSGLFKVLGGSFAVNESGTECNVSPGLVDICKNVEATNKSIFALGTNLQGDQLVIFDQLMPVFRYGVNPGGLLVGPTSVNNQYITSNQSTNQRINFWDGGIMEIQTASTGDGGSYIVIEPQNTETMRITSTGGITVSSSMTVKNTSASSQYVVGFSTSSSGASVHFSTTGHLMSKGSSPTLSSCGTDPSIVGTDSAFTLTGGTGSTGCVVTFLVPFVSTPTCTVTNQSPSVVNAMSYIVSATSITITETGFGTTKVDGICIGHD